MSDKLKSFIKKAREIHGDKYDYSKVDYRDNKTPVDIVCPNKAHGINGIFSQRPDNHLMGKGCKDCGIEKRSATKIKNAGKKFFIEASKIHKGYYSYDKAIYKGKNTPITIYCPVHGYFSSQSPSNHLKGRGCTPCGRKRTAEFHSSSKEEFIEKARRIHGNKYNYDKVEYTRATDNVIITCPIPGHGINGKGDFPQTPQSHIDGSGCHDCGGSKPLNKETFIKKAIIQHGDYYDYSKVKYKNNKTAVTIICPYHSDFPQTPDAHLVGKGCDKCKNKNEGLLAEYLVSIHVVFRQHRIKNRFYDFYLPKYNLLIERDGEQHYKEVSLFDDSLKAQQKIDKEKTKLAKEHGFEIARIPFWLNVSEAQIEMQNIINGQPTYPDIPDLKQLETKPKPNVEH